MAFIDETLAPSVSEACFGVRPLKLANRWKKRRHVSAAESDGDLTPVLLDGQEAA